MLLLYSSFADMSLLHATVVHLLVSMLLLS
jgi:hypothetical protein